MEANREETGWLRKKNERRKSYHKAQENAKPQMNMTEIQGS